VASGRPGEAPGGGAGDVEGPRRCLDLGADKPVRLARELDLGNVATVAENDLVRRRQRGADVASERRRDEAVAVPHTNSAGGSSAARRAQKPRSPHGGSR
jgi:hypothetical protein